MADDEPLTELQPGFSSAGATPTAWAEAREHLDAAQIYWLTTVRPDGRPHVTPLFAVWLAGALHFGTGPDERKARNLAQNPRCVVTTGCNVIDGLDLVVEGEAVRVSDDARLQRLADAWAAKYADASGAGLGDDWRFTVRDGALAGPGGNLAYVYEVRQTTAFGFGKGAVFSQTRWRFSRR